MKKVIAVCGPTAVGKTRMGVSLAEALHGEVISGDSMRIYRTMDIGTAKVTEEEMQGIIHHMIDIKNPDETFSVSEFQKRSSSLYRYNRYAYCGRRYRSLYQRCSL
ncbi:isopentenyl transferase family protein [Catenibacterium sp. co_0103]|uniref:isopentenyl transferase family protein n=1 Tax=Catenibacterium sp. co_0103 TaxID=2478954 RepID=UPI0032AFD600